MGTKDDLSIIAKAQVLCPLGRHARVTVSAVCGHRDVCTRCGDHKHGAVACARCAGSGMLPADGYSMSSGAIECDLCDGAERAPCWASKR